MLEEETREAEKEYLIGGGISSTEFLRKVSVKQVISNVIDVHLFKDQSDPRPEEVMDDPAMELMELDEGLGVQEVWPDLDWTEKTANDPEPGEFLIELEIVLVLVLHLFRQSLLKLV